MQAKKTLMLIESDSTGADKMINGGQSKGKIIFHNINETALIR